MPEEEVRQQKASLLLEAHEAEQELAHLAEKAKRKAAYLKAFGEWLNDMAETPLYNDTFTADIYASALGNVNVLADDGFRSAMNFDELEKLFRTLDDVRRRLVKLNERKTSLGLL